MPGPRKPKKAKDQAIAEEKALLAGTLPPQDRREDDRREDDRRAPEPEAVAVEAAPEAVVEPVPAVAVEAPVVAEVPEPVVGAPVAEAVRPVLPNDQLHVVREGPNGKKVNALGQEIDWCRTA